MKKVKCARLAFLLLALVPCIAIAGDRPGCLSAILESVGMYDLFFPVRGKILPVLEWPLTRLVSDAPYVWVDNPLAAKSGAKHYIRGVSGGWAASRVQGTVQALKLFMGREDAYERYASPLEANDLADPRGDNIFARPLIIHGQVENFSTFAWDSNTHANGPFVLIPPGPTLYWVDQFGIFPPESFGSPPGPGGRLLLDVKEWAQSYLYFCRTLKSFGIFPTPNSRGEHFLAELKSALTPSSGQDVREVIAHYEIGRYPTYRP